MSWGERSCLKPCRVPNECSFETCNVNCRGYKWDGFTQPDSISHSEAKAIEDRTRKYNEQKDRSERPMNRAERRAQKKSGGKYV